MNRFLAHISVLLFTSLPTLALAQETAPEHAMEGAVDQAVAEAVTQNHEGGGMPQFNPDTWASQIFWLAIAFGLLYFFFSKAVLPSMTATLTARADKISGDLKAARHLSFQAQEIKDKYEAELKKAAGQASSDMKKIDEEAKAKLATALQSFRDKSQTEISAIETRIEASKAGALDDMQKIAAEIAAQAAQKIAGIPADSAQAETVVRSLKNKAA